MGSSFVRYRGAGFWTRDTTIELWLFLLADEVRNLENPPVWLLEAAHHIQATVGMNGCVSTSLDQYVATPDRTQVVLELAERTLHALRSRGELLSAEWLNSMALGGPGSYFSGDVPADVFLRVGEAFVRLLRGEITWNASNAPVV